jgi:hypothetical protein
MMASKAELIALSPVPFFWSCEKEREKKKRKKGKKNERRGAKHEYHLPSLCWPVLAPL